MRKKFVTLLSAIVLLFTIGFTPNDVQAATLEPGEVSPFAAIGVCDYTMSGYQLHSTTKSNTKVDKLIAGGASIIVSTYVPWKRGKIGIQISNTAHMILRDNVYYTQTYYRMFANTKSPKPVAAEKTITRYYSNSARTKLIDTKTSYNYSNWYCKS